MSVVAVERWREDTAPLKPIRKARVIKWRWKRSWKPILVFAALLVGCGVLSKTAQAPTPVVIATPAPAPAPAVQPSSAPAPAVLPPKPTIVPVPAPLVKGDVSGPCLVTAACVGQAIKVPKTGAEGVGFLVSKGQTVFAPVAGRLMYVPAMEADPPYPEVLLMLMTGGNIELANVKTTLAQATMVEAGQPIGEVASTTTIGGMSYDFSVFARPVSLADTLYPKLLRH